MKRLGNAIDKFVQSDLMIVFNALFIILGWCFDIWVPMLAVVIALNILPLFFFKSTKHLLSILILFMLAIRTNRHALGDYVYMLALVPVLFVGILVNLIRFKRSFKSMRPRKIRGFHVSLLALVIPFALGGVGSQTENVWAILIALAFIVLVGLGYSFMWVTNVDDENKQNLMDYVIKNLAMMGVITAIQCLIVLSKVDGSLQEIITFITSNRSYFDVGWAGPNNIGITLAMCVPATLYLCVKKNYLTPLFVLIAVCEFALIFLTGSRGSVLVALATIVPILLYVIVKSENKLLFGVSVSAAIIGVAVIILSKSYIIDAITSRFANLGLSSNGRFDGLFVEAIDNFKQHPFFGVGWDYRLGGLTSDNYSPYWFHSTALQILANMGVVGIVAFLPFYFFRYTTFLRLMKKSVPACALFASTLIFEAYGMMDTLYFSPTFFIIMVIMTFACEINLPERFTKKERLEMRRAELKNMVKPNTREGQFPAPYIAPAPYKPANQASIADDKRKSHKRR